MLQFARSSLFLFYVGNGKKDRNPPVRLRKLVCMGGEVSNPAGSVEKKRFLSCLLFSSCSGQTPQPL